MFYFTKTPRIIKRIFPKLVWDVATSEKAIYLTFDDGPVPEVTPWVLEQLKKYKAEATFFCVGANVKRHQNIYEQILNEGHSAGNHTYCHLNGWKVSTQDYIEDVKKCAEVVNSKLFRPPYGKIKPSQYSALNTQYSIIMWDVLCGDWDKNISTARCEQNIIKNTRPGSIVVLHDNVKAFDRLKVILPAFLKHFSEKGFKFEKLKMD